MCPARALAGCLLLLAALEPSALTVGHVEGGPPDDSSARGLQLAKSGAAQREDGQELYGDAADPPGCEPAARHVLARKCKKRYRAQWESSVEAAFKSVGGPAYLVVGEVRTRKLLRNFFAHAQNLSSVGNTSMRIVSVQLDHNGTLDCERAREVFQTDTLDLRCVDLGGWLPAELFGKRVDSSVGSCAHNMVLWSKPEIFLTAVKASDHDVIMIDTDVVIYDDLFKLGSRILAQGRDYIVVATEERGVRNPNTGVVLGTKSGAKLIELWTKENFNFVDSFAGDQSAFQSLWKRSPNLWKFTGVFNPSQIGQCGNRGAWATHYNCHGGQGMKEAIMISRRDWSEELSKHTFGDWRPDPSKDKRKHKLGQLYKVNLSEPLYVDDDSGLAAVLMDAGDWWIDD